MKNLYRYKIYYTLKGGTIFQAIKTQNPEYLKEILLRNYQEHGEIILKLTYSLNDSEIKVLVDVLLQLDFIEYLFLEDTLPSNNGAILLSQLLKQKKNIKEFKLSGPRINTVGAKAIAESLIDNTNIEKFELSNTNFGDEGAIAFSEILNKIGRAHV